MESRVIGSQPRVVYLDTGGLWCLDAMLYPKKFHEPRWKEYLAYLCDYLCDPNREIRCIVPSAEREGGPLPSFYKSLLKAGLMTRAEVLGANQLITPVEELEDQFSEFKRHVYLNPKIIGSWYNLHNHPDIRKGWLIGVPDQSHKWQGVPSWLEDFLKRYHVNDLDQIRQSHNWPRWRTAITFSFIQRAFPYSIQAAVRQSEYLTHPIRWQVLRNPSTASPDVSFGLALGGIIVGSLGTNLLRKDAQAVADAIASVREKIAQAHNDWSQVETPNQARDLLLPLLPGAIGGKPTPNFEKVLKGIIEALLVIGYKLTPNATDQGATAIWLISKLILTPLPVTLSKTEALLFRRWVDYPKILDLDVKTCFRCGGAMYGAECLICAEREKTLEAMEAQD